MKSYLLGYCVGYVLDNVAGDNVFLLEKNRQVEGPTGRWFNEPETIIFKTREKAEAKARRMMKGSSARWFTRGYEYVTDNPKNAKGLKLISEMKNTGTIWLS